MRGAVCRVLILNENRLERENMVKILEDYEEEVDRILPTDGKGAGGVSDGI